MWISLYKSSSKSDNILNYYPDEYWDINEELDENLEIKFKRVVHRYINKISYKLTISPQPGGKVLDIGCGDGKDIVKTKKRGLGDFWCRN